jgi:hypothetical protein
MRNLSRAAAALFVALGALSGCTSLLGDFSNGGGGATDGGRGGDTGVGSGDSGVHHDAAADGSMANEDGGEDAAVDGGTDAPPPPPAPPPGKPGLDITSGGNSSQSINYKVVAALGEAPGAANMVSKSSNYTLKGGVIAGTQAQ